jgi:hypothetical protein
MRRKIPGENNERNVAIQPTVTVPQWATTKEFRKIFPMSEANLYEWVAIARL